MQLLRSLPQSPNPSPSMLLFQFITFFWAVLAYAKTQGVWANHPHWSLGWGSIWYYSTGFNNFFLSLWSMGRNVWRPWFQAGVYAGLLISALGWALLLFNLFILLFPASTDQEPVLNPLIPGVSMPFDQIGYLMIALATNGFVHEAGHALAAIADGVSVQGFGLFAMLVYPGFYTNLSQADLDLAPPIAKLRIICAGAWNNVAFSGIAYSLLLILPSILSPFYVTSTSPVVLSVSPYSPLVDKIPPGSLITGLGTCPVSSIIDWQSCLLAEYDTIEKHPNLGFCITLDDVQGSLQTFPTSPCCNPNDPTYSSTTQCFALDTNQEICLEASQALSARCDYTSDCGFYQTCGRAKSLVQGEFYSSLSYTLPSGKTSSLVWAGTVSDLYAALDLGPFAPKVSWMPLSGPRMVERTLRYIISVGSALAVLNMVPMYALDGQHSTLPYLQYLFPTWAPGKMERVRTALLYAGSGALALNMFITFLTTAL